MIDRKKLLSKELKKCYKLASILESIRANGNIFIYKNCEFDKAKNAVINVNNKLGIGKVVGYTGKLKTTFMMEENSKLDVLGKFQIYTGCKIVCSFNIRKLKFYKC